MKRFGVLFLIAGVALGQKSKPAPAPAATKAPITKAPCDLVIEAGGVLTVDPTFKILRESSIAVTDGVILAISSIDEINARYEPKERIERKSSIVLPGFVNTHTHAAMDLLRGIADDKPLMEWLN